MPFDMRFDIESGAVTILPMVNAAILLVRNGVRTSTATADHATPSGWR